MSAPTTRVAVIADTHIPRRARDLPAPAWEHIDRSDVVIHAGDVLTGDLLRRLAAGRPVVAVRGNNDRALDGLPEQVEVDIGGVAVAVVHDAGPVAGRRARLRRRFPSARVAVFGHSHVPVVDDDGDLLLLNPGSPTDRRRMPTFTMASLDIGAGGVTAAIIDLGRARA